MIRTIRNLVFLCIGLLCGGYASFSHAELTDSLIRYRITDVNGYSQSYFSAPLPSCQDYTSWFAGHYTGSSNNPTITGTYPGYFCQNSPSFVNKSISYQRFCGTGGALTQSDTKCNYTTACTAPQVRSTATGLCESPPPTCTAGTSNSYSNTNLTVKGLMPESVCIDSCTYNYSGKTSVGSGEFAQTYGSVGGGTGASCTASSVSTAQQAEKDCVEQGKSFITASGTTTCVSPGTPNSPTVTNKTNSTNTSTNSSGTTTTNTTTNTTVNNNQVTVTNTTVTTNPDGSTSTATNGTTQTLNSYCQSNPSASICTSGQFSTGVTGGSGTSSCTGCATEATASAIKDKLTVDGSGSGDAAAGYPSVPDSFYTATYQNGLQGVWGDFKAQVNSTQFVSGINGFVPSGWDSGTAPSWNIDFSGLHAGWGSIEVSPASNIWLFIKIIFVVTTLFLCRTIIFGG